LSGARGPVPYGGLMRYNPPPNWPKPPEGWAPHADWSPDPSWPPPPPGWRLWVEDDGPSAQRKSALGQLKSAGDDSEYFGGEFAWADDHGPAPSEDDLHAASPAPQTQRTEVDPKDLSVQHLGKYATIKSDDDELRYDIGKIVAVSADPGVIRVKLAGIDVPVVFQREVPAEGIANPRLYVWI
jgi:hypothetical protein